MILSRSFLASAMLIAAVVLVACGGSDEPAVEADRGFSAERLQSLARNSRIDCPAYVSVNFKALGFECHSSDVPENYALSNGPRIKVLSMVRRTSAATPKGTIYLLDGGPGGNGLQYVRDPLLRDAFNADGWDVVIPGHRGTHSSLLSCPKGEAANKILSDRVASPCQPGTSSSQACMAALAEREGCAGELVEQRGGGDKGALALSQYDTVNAARDIVAAQVAITRTSQMVAVGVSYGTYWAQRLAQLHPESVNRVVLDSSLNLKGRIEEGDLYVQQLLEDVLDDCIADAGCKARFGYVSGKDALAKAVTAINSGKCGAQALSGVSADVITVWNSSGYGMLARVVLSAPENRPLAPYLIKVAADCDAPRVAQTLTQAQAKLPTSFPPEAPGTLLEEKGINQNLFNTVVYTELIDSRDPVRKADIERVVATLKGGPLGEPGNAVSFLNDMKNWAVIIYNNVVKSFKTVSSPVLVLSSRIDIATPRQMTDGMIADMKADGVLSELYRTNYSAHSVLRTSGDKERPESRCGIKRTLDFINARPAADFSCQELSIDWGFTGGAARDAALDLLGKANPWLN